MGLDCGFLFPLSDWDVLLALSLLRDKAGIT